MEDTAHRAIAIVGTGAILPDAPDVPRFWSNIKESKYSITEISPDRWDPALYYDADPHAPDKSYSKIGGWVREYAWEPAKWRIAIPPCVVDAMDIAQRWAIACTRQALEDFGYPQRTFDPDRTAVILGNAMAGEKHYLTALRIYFPEYATELEHTSSFSTLPEALRTEIKRELQQRIAKRLPEISEDTMPGELANCIAGRIANIFNLHGPNFVVDAACASAMAAFNAAVEGLIENEFDVAITGGIDRNMGASTFIKFCKIGALSATGTRPYAKGADGFVMGEGAAIFLLKRLADAERDGDRIYAVLRGMGASSDGKGKGITAPNPIGQKLSIERAWKAAGVAPTIATLFEGHGTSTRVGDVVETQCLSDFVSQAGLPRDSVALGSVKSNIGHLKGAAGAAGLLKTVLALRDKVTPPSLNCSTLNPDIDLSHSPIYVNTELKPWDVKDGAVRSAGVSAFGFGGTNFHAVLEEYIPNRLNGNGKRSVAVTQPIPIQSSTPTAQAGTNLPGEGQATAIRKPLRGALVMGADSTASLVEKLRAVETAARSGRLPESSTPSTDDLRAPERIAIDYGDAAELVDRCAKALKAFVANMPAMWQALRAQGVFRGKGPAGKVAFLYPGQGSQYINMLAALRSKDPVVEAAFAETDRVLTPLLGKPISEFIFVDPTDAEAVAKAEEDLKQTAITQPAVLASDVALTRLFATYGIRPDLTMGHSLGEYGALVTSGVLSFADALEAVSARGREMTRVAMKDNGKMAAVFAPLAEIEHTIKTIPGYVVIANINSNQQAVIGGESEPVEQAITAFMNAGYNAVSLSVSHAFHTSIVAPASEPLRRMLERLRVQTPKLPIVANVDGEFYPMESGATDKVLDILARQIASPVQFVKGLHTLYEAGARVFVEVGPKKALQGFVESVLGERGDIVALFTNHPKIDDAVAFNQALCGLYAAGIGCAQEDAVEKEISSVTESGRKNDGSFEGRYEELGHYFADVLEHGWHMYQPNSNGSKKDVPVVVTGAALGLPGNKRVFDEENIGRILGGEQFIDAIPMRIRRAMLDKHITRLVKNETGAPVFESITDIADVIKLAARGGTFDLEKEFGIASERVASMDRTTALAIAVGIDALRDAGIPLVMRYKTTSKGTMLPERWGLPDALRDDTGVIFASAFPGYDAFAKEMERYYAFHARCELLASLEKLRSRESNGHAWIWAEVDSQIEELRAAIQKDSYTFDRRFLFRVLSMGHSQFAELIGARGPNTQINSACASTTQAVSLAEDWIRAGRSRRVIVVSADDVTSDNLLEWMGAGFLASGAAATDETVENAAIPFDKRRHGMLVGMGAAALVLESADAARERGLQPICEVLSSVTANSAYHGTRLDQEHISGLMEKLISEAEARHHIAREQIAPKTVFVSHETYTPARGGSASAEVQALRKVFKDHADEIVIANTKGFTGHAMATGMEDVVAVKALETAWVPPVANFKEVDPELGSLNLSKGGVYPIEYALRLGAGFGSQISMTLMRWVPTKDGVRRSPKNLNYEYRIADRATWSEWIAKISGHASAQLEVVKHTLRVRQDIPAVTQVAPEPTLAKPAATTIPAVQEKPAVSAPTPTVKTEVQIVTHIASADVPAAPKDVVIPTAPVPAAALPSPKAVESPIAENVPTAAASPDAVKQRVLALVAEKTGYPIEMLDVDLDLEADLGVDTVKQAEVFATIRTEYGIQRDDTVKLRDFPTLAHVIRFVLERQPGQKAPAAVTAPTVVEENPASAPQPRVSEPVAIAAVPVDFDDEAVKEEVIAMVVEKTGYPKEMLDLDLDLDLEADLGVDTVKQAEMFVAIRAKYNIPRDDNRKLRDYPTLAHVIRFVHENRPDLAPKARDAKIQENPATVLAPPITAVPAEAKREQVVATQAVAAPSLAEADDESVKEAVLAMVVEKTGYPKEMLDLDLDLEADLGVDTVKQAEMFVAIREKYNIPRDDNRKLRDYPTLAHVIRFVHENRPDIAKKPASAKVTPAVQVVSVDVTSTKPKLVRARTTAASFEQADAIPRRVPVPVLRPPMEFCKQTGVKLERGSRVVLMPDKGRVADVLKQRLETRGAEVLQLDPNSSHDELLKAVSEFASRGAVQGVYWLPALDDEGSIAAMALDTWHKEMHSRVKLLYTAMRSLYEQIASPGTFLVSATRLGGQHGYGETGASQPMGGAVVGFTKTYKREQLDVTVKAVDFEVQSAASEIADALIEESLRDNGAVEIGYKQGVRWSVALQEVSARDGQPGLDLNLDTVFVVTGAAGSIVSAITADLANASGGIFYLLDLVPEPDRNNPDLNRLTTDREALKRELFARIQSRGERATPALVERELAALERGRAALDAITAVEAAGGTVHYCSVNLRDSDAVAKVIERVRADHGRIDVLLHAAGMERSHMLPFKEPGEFDLVFDVKADGWFNLLHAIGEMSIGATVAFSSIAGRFGNAGQTDYSSANDLLCKYTSNLRVTRPATRGIAIDWTAWAGIGMASRGSIPKMMEVAGIDMLLPEAGVPTIRRELTTGGTRGEVLVGQKLGILLNEWDATGGIDACAAEPRLAKQGPMVGNIVASLHDGLTVETTLDPASQPFLHDHQINGTPVLPGVMGVEAFAEAALCLLPGWRVEALEDVNFLAPFKFYRNEPRAIALNVQFRPQGDAIIAACKMIGKRPLPTQTEPQLTIHFTACLRLTNNAAQGSQCSVPITKAGECVAAAEIYRVYFHGPAYQVLKHAWRNGGRIIGEFSDTLPKNHVPVDRPLLVNPRLIELCFQTAGLWEISNRLQMGLPNQIESVQCWRVPKQVVHPIYAIVTPDPSGTFDADVVDTAGNRYLQLRGYRTVALPEKVDAGPLKALHAVAA